MLVSTDSCAATTFPLLRCKVTRQTGGNFGLGGESVAVGVDRLIKLTV